MHLVLHSQVDHIWVRRGTPERCREQSSTLQVEDLNETLDFGNSYCEGIAVLTTSALVYSFGSTSRAFAVGTTKSGIIAMVLISLAHWNFL